MISTLSDISAPKLIEELAANGRYSITSAQAREALGVSADATKLALNRLARQGRIASPARGFYVIVPPEYRALGCLPADQFIPDLMETKGLAYYAGLLTAAQYYGAAHQRPQAFQVVTRKNRRPILCGKVRVEFVARKNIEAVPVRRVNTPRGLLNVSSPEATAIDLVGYPQHAGGIDNVATVLGELAIEIDPTLLAQAAPTAPITWVQRLGYLLERVEAGNVAADIKAYVADHAREYTPLVPGLGTESGRRVPGWKLIVNADVEPDL